MDADFYNPFDRITKVLKSLGMWQDGNQTWRYFFCGLFFHLICIYLYFILEFIYGFNPNNSLVDSADALAVGFAVLTTALKSINFFIRVRSFGKYIDHLNELLNFSADEKFANRAHIRKEVNFAFKVYKFFWASAMTTCIIAAFVPFIAHKLPWQAWLPFNVEYDTIGFWIASFYLAAAAFPVATIDITLDILPVLS
jgi:hypothetical protein